MTLAKENKTDFEYKTHVTVEKHDIEMELMEPQIYDSIAVIAAVILPVVWTDRNICNVRAVIESRIIHFCKTGTDCNLFQISAS